MNKPGIFASPNGKSYFITFALISSLFFLWALCNGMIDVMDKHFQELLHLNKAQSAWVQFAHYDVRMGLFGRGVGPVQSQSDWLVVSG